MDKFQLPILKTAQFFIPSIMEVSEFLGCGSSPRRLMRFFAKITNTTQTLPSNRSLDNIAKKGVKWSTIRPFFWSIIRPLYKTGFKISDVPKPNLPKNKISKLELSLYLWETSIWGFANGLKQSSPDDNITLFQYFIEQRINQYRPTIEIITAFQATSKAEIDNEILLRFYDSFLSHTLLTNEEQSTVRGVISRIECISLSQQNPSIDIVKKELEESAPTIYLLQNDFYLSLFSIIDITLLNDTENLKKYPTGLLGKILTQESQTFLGKFFLAMKIGWNVNYTDIAQHIHLPNSEYKRNGSSKLDIQIERFKEWRSGKSLPSNKAVFALFESLSSDDKFKIYGTDSLSLYAILMLNLDKQAKSNSGIKLAFTQDNYQRYFDSFKNMQLQFETA